MFAKIKSVCNSVVSGAKKALAGAAFAVGAGVAAVTGSAPVQAAITVDYTGAVTSAESQVSSAITAGLPIFGAIVAVWVGIRIFKRLVHG